MRYKIQWLVANDLDDSHTISTGYLNLGQHGGHGWELFVMSKISTEISNWLPQVFSLHFSKQNQNIDLILTVWKSEFLHQLLVLAIN